MHTIRSKALFLALGAASLGIVVTDASAAIVISEVDSAGSASSVQADWFELTNTGSAAVDIAGWKMDDNSDSFADAVALTGPSSIAAGQTVVFIESTGSTAATVDAAFKAAWFGSNDPSTLALGNYSGSGVGLGQSGDAVNIFNASGVAQAGVTFGASSSNGSSGGTFDNTAGISGAISQVSVIGVNGAFKAPDGEIGSPGIDAAVTPVPVPASAWLLLGGLSGCGVFARRVRAARTQRLAVP
jgi:hypothetical protein